jgi:transcriptional regulator with XRE-family HTH domain
MTIKQDILDFLRQRRRELRMPIYALSERANTSVSTVKSVLGGNASVSYSTLCRIAQAMGASFEVNARSSNSVIKEEAKRKARILAKMVQGTSAMEAQAVDKETLDRIAQTAEAELTTHLGSMLWAK